MCFSVGRPRVKVQKMNTAGRAFAIQIGGRLLTQPVYRIRTCPRTGLHRREPTLSDEDLDFYYANNEWWRHCFPRLFPTEELLRAALVTHLPTDAAVLDIGCGDGRLLSSLPGSYRKCGTELSAGAAQAATAKGVEIVSHEEMLAGVHGKFDAVTLVDVFEHLRDPHEFLQSLLGCLKTGGLIGISTGDGDYCMATEDPANFWYWRVIAHLSMFTKDYSLFVEKELGLQRVYQKRSSHYPFAATLWGKQFVQKVAYEYWHDRKHHWFAPAAFLVPSFRRARDWRERPVFWYARDHTVTLWRKER
jgi:2-polyprenyl-3-methyl-5-hydroxy-6-metoxy-1,4-benzoquinol methylase